MKKILVFIAIIPFLSCAKKHQAKLIQKECCMQNSVNAYMDSCLLFIPNIFTPNGDGEDDLFMMYGANVASLKIQVFNKKDQVIFESTNPAFTWDGVQQGGKWKGETLEGNYKFVFDAVSTSGKNIHAESSVGVILDICKYEIEHISNCAWATQFDPNSASGWNSALPPDKSIATCK